MSLEICRVCLEKGSNLTSLSDKEVCLGDKITACVPEINVFIVNDPQICTTCLSMLETAHKFRDKCLLTERRISKFFESLYLKTVGRLSRTDEKHSERTVELSEYLNAFILEGLAGINEPSTKTNEDDKTLAVRRMQSCYVALNNCVRRPETPSKQTKDLKKSTNKKKNAVVANEKTIAATNFHVRQTRKTNTTYKNKIYRHVTGTEDCFSASVCETEQVNSKRKDKSVRFDYEEVINKFSSSETANPVKAVRGRKRKVVNVNELKTVTEQPQTKRPRGRPRKIVVIEQEVNVSSEETTENQLSDSNEEIAADVGITSAPSESCVVDYSVKETEPDVTCTTESEFYEYSVNNLCEICDVVFSNVEGWRRHIKDHIFAV